MDRPMSTLPALGLELHGAMLSFFCGCRGSTLDPLAIRQALPTELPPQLLAVFWVMVVVLFPPRQVLTEAGMDTNTQCRPG